MAKPIILRPPPSGPTNKSFGYTMSVFFSLLWIFSCWKANALVFHFGLPVSILFFLISLFAPDTLYILNKLWARFGVFLHKIISPLIMALIYFGVFTPFGIIMRLSEKDPLQKSFDPKLKSYWITRKKDQEIHLKNQF